MDPGRRRVADRRGLLATRARRHGALAAGSGIEERHGFAGALRAGGPCRGTARREAAAARSKELEATQKRAKKALSVESVNALLRTGPDAVSRAALGRTLGRLYCFTQVDVMGLWVNVEARVMESEARLRLNHVALALAAYRAEKGRFPARLAELSPGYLAAVPKDPFTDRALSYEPRGAGYLLYSVGPDQKPDTAAGAKTGDDILVRAE